MMICNTGRRRIDGLVVVLDTREGVAPHRTGKEGFNDLVELTGNIVV